MRKKTAIKASRIITCPLSVILTSFRSLSKSRMFAKSSNITATDNRRSYEGECLMNTESSWSLTSMLRMAGEVAKLRKKINVPLN